MGPRAHDGALLDGQSALLQQVSIHTPLFPQAPERQSLSPLHGEPLAPAPGFARPTSDASRHIAAPFDVGQQTASPLPQSADVQQPRVQKGWPGWPSTPCGSRQNKPAGHPVPCPHGLPTAASAEPPSPAQLSSTTPLQSLSMPSPQASTSWQAVHSPAAQIWPGPQAGGPIVPGLLHFT